MDEREAITVRFPSTLLAEAKSVKAARESLNELVVTAVEREVRRRQGVQAYENIVRVREMIRERGGLQPDSRALIRSLRDGQERRG